MRWLYCKPHWRGALHGQSIEWNEDSTARMRVPEVPGPEHPVGLSCREVEIREVLFRPERDPPQSVYACSEPVWTAICQRRLYDQRRFVSSRCVTGQIRCDGCSGKPPFEGRLVAGNHAPQAVACGEGPGNR